MEIKIRTLTPLWTGGIDGTTDCIHETGILGSLRWWYEALVRGLGGYACDPSQGTCRFDADKYAKSKALEERQRLHDAGLCDVCQVFGATGWRRRFRLEIVDNTILDCGVAQRVQANRSYTNNQGKTLTPTWYFLNKPRSGSLTIQIQSLTADFPSEVIAGLIRFIADWAAIGARPQMGFGVVNLEDGQLETKSLYNWLVLKAGCKTYPNLPSLRNIFLARISPQNDKKFSDQDTFNLKYDLRRLFANDKPLRHFIMGTVKDQRMAAKVKMSRPFNDGQEMRVWGWIPEEANAYKGSWNRNTIVDAIYEHLGKNYNLQVWREMNSPRDPVTSTISDTKAFLQSLLYT